MCCRTAIARGIDASAKTVFAVISRGAPWATASRFRANLPPRMLRRAKPFPTKLSETVKVGPPLNSNQGDPPLQCIQSGDQRVFRKKGGHIVDLQTERMLQAVLRGKARRILRFRICIAGLHRRSSDGYIRGCEERQCHLCASCYGWPGIGCMDAARCGWATVTVGGIWVDPLVVAGFPGPG